MVTARVMATPAAQGLDASRVLVTPTPFNTVLWRIVLRHDDHYAEGFYSLVDRVVDPQRPLRFARYPRGPELEALAARSDDARHIKAFSKGFYALSERGGRVYITDLRMGQHPFYAFSFAFAERRDGEPVLIEPLRETRRLPLAEGTAWLWDRMAGNDMPPPA
jgi:inner membrane protein